MRCPDCGTRVSTAAPNCAHCGRAITPQTETPTAKWDELINGAYNALSLGPALANALEAAFPTEYLTAKLPPEFAAQVKAGTAHFQIDKNGEILAQLVDNDGSFVHNLRLESLQLTPDMLTNLVALQQMAAMAQIMKKLKTIEAKIDSITDSINDDRLAIADSAIQQLEQASSFMDSRLKEMKILEAAGRATDAKNQLSRALVRQTNSVRVGADNPLRPFIELPSKKTARYQASEQALETLAVIIRLVQVEVSGMCMLGEVAAAHIALEQFNGILHAAQITSRDDMLALASFAPTDQTPLVNAFDTTMQEITALSAQLEGSLPSAPAQAALVTAGHSND